MKIFNILHLAVMSIISEVYPYSLFEFLIIYICLCRWAYMSLQLGFALLLLGYEYCIIM